MARVPDRIFLIVVEQSGDRDPDQMPLLTRIDAQGLAHTPAFSSMLLATTFLSRAQQLGQFIKLDYIFPADGGRLAEDFPRHRVHLDPSPEAFFEGVSAT
jgi:hypothetical protein